MEYDYPLYRPPSEAYSLILQVTLGCSHNACTFCTMYKTKRYYEKSWSEIESLINETAPLYPRTKRIFLADGNALALPTEVLADTIEMLYAKFPHLERVSIYGGPLDALRKSPEELSILRQKGLHLVYLGIESGSDQILQFVNKGVSASEMIEAGKKVRASGLLLSATVISGLGGQEMWQEHSLETARVVSAINPDYLGFLTLSIPMGSLLGRQIDQGKFKLLTPWEILREMELFLQNVELEECVFRSNHASNYFRLGGVLNRDRDELLQAVAVYLQDPRIKALPADSNRIL